MKLNYSIKTKMKDTEFMNKLRQSFTQVMIEMLADAKRYAPVATGTLRRGINLEKKGDLHYELKDSVYYGVMVEFGTKPHVIKPVRAKALHWEKPKGVHHFSKKVNHPGTNAQPFFRPALNNAMNNLKERLI
jgi:HK97 gp10 family phage protein